MNTNSGRGQLLNRLSLFDDGAQCNVTDITKEGIKLLLGYKINQLNPYIDLFDANETFIMCRIYSRFNIN